MRALEVKKGDRVLFGKYSGNEIKIDGVEHIILREDDVLGVHREVTIHTKESRRSTWQPRKFCSASRAAPRS